jgi:integrase
MASITKIANRDGSQSYRVNWRVGDSKDGQRRQEYKTFTSFEDARAHRRTVEEDIESRRVGGTKQLTVHQYLDNWLEAVERRMGRGDLSPKTAEGYGNHLAIAKRSLVDQRLSRLTRSALNSSYDKMLESGKLLRDGKTGPLTKRTVHHVHSVLHNALADAVRDKLISENPAASATPPKVQGKKYRRKVRDYTKDEAERQLHIAKSDKRYPPDTYLMALMLAICGPRRGELCGLAFNDAVDFEAAKISIFRNILEVKGEALVREVPKTDASVRTISIPLALVELLKQQRKRVLEMALKWGKDYARKPLYVFPGPGGLPMHPKLVTRRMERLALRAGIDMAHVSPVHSWRHTSGSMLWAASRDIKQVQERLGHTDPQITMALYVHSAPTADEAAAEHLGKLISRSLKKPLPAMAGVFSCPFSEVCTFAVYFWRSPQLWQANYLI